MLFKLKTLDFSPQPNSNSTGSGDWQVRSRGSNKKRKRDDDSSECSRPRVLGGVSESSLTTPEEKELFDVLHNIISQVVIMVEGNFSFQNHFYFILLVCFFRCRGLS